MVNVNTRYHQRSKKIALPALIHAKMRLEHLWRMHFLVSQLRFAPNFRLQLELDELLHISSLDEHCRSLLVNGHAQLVLLREEQRVLLRGKFESEIFKQRTKLCRLLFRQSVSI